MKILRVEVENFVCYYGLQTIDLEPKGGKPVVIIHGDNGFGKTSLFRAISWCLFGKQGRRGFDALSLFNWGAREDGKTLCSAKVVFEDGGHRYTASRWYSRTGIGPAEKFDSERFSWLDGTGKALPEEGFPALMGRIFPYEVSQLFLFDGEELQTYESLVDADKDAQNAALRSRLEMVIGVPALQAARSAAQTALERLEEVRDAAVSAAAEDGVTRAELAKLKSDIQRSEDDLTEARKTRDAEKIEVERIQRLLLGMDAVARLVREQLSKQHQLAALTAELATGYQQRCDASGPLYIEILRGPLEETVNGLRQNEREARQGQTEALKLLGRQELLSEVLVDGTCVCSTRIDAGKKVFVQTRLDSTIDAAKRLPPSARQPMAWGWIADQIDEVLGQDCRRAYSAAEAAVSGLIVERATLEGEIQAIDSVLQSSGKEEIRTLSESLTTHSASLARLDGDIRAMESDLSQLRTKQKALEANALRGSSRADAVKNEQQRVVVAAEAANAFEAAIDELRQIKRNEVQKAASDAFVAMRWKKDFTGLRIQKGYGLVIQTVGDKDIPARSAGEGQIVALALLTGLNRCANIRAPIIMDTPFSRLDRAHRRNVLQYLAHMGDQIVLLATSGEIDDTDISAIRSDIANEWQIEFISHGRSRIRS